MASADPDGARRMTAKGRATRERILQGAAEVILAEGLSELSLGTLRKAASVSGSQLNHYYADKQEAIRAVIARQSDVVLNYHALARQLSKTDDATRQTLAAPYDR